MQSSHRLQSKHICLIENNYNIKEWKIKMRSWSLVCASLVASLVSVLSFIIPFCAFLYVQQDHVTRLASRGFEIMVYLTLILWLIGFIAYAIVLAVLKLPKKIFDLVQILKSGLILFIVWMSLVLMIFLEAQVDQTDFSVLFIGLIVYFALLFLMVLGCMSANACYFVLENKRKEIF